MMGRILRSLDARFEEVVCVAALAIMTGSVLLQVVLRFFFSTAAAWAEETAVYSMIAAVYLGACLAVRDRAHIRITLLVNALPRPLQIASVVLADLLWIGFLMFMTWQTLLYVSLLFDVTYRTPGLGIEQRWIQMFLPAFFLLMLARVLQVYWRWRADGFRGLPL